MSNKENLYHYCSFDAFRSIIQNRTLRFSDITKMDDESELNFGENACIEAYKDMQPFVAGIKGFASANNRGNITFVACFSREENSPHFWKTRDVCIAFHREKVENWVRGIQHMKWEGGEYFRGDYQDIKYYTDAEMAEKAKELCDKSTDKNAPEIADLLYQTSRYIKRKEKRYEEEKETRCAFVVNSSRPPEKPDGESDSVPILFGAKGEYPIAAYCDIPFPPDMIAAVYLKPYSRLDAEDCRKFLECNGLCFEEVKEPDRKMSIKFVPLVEAV